MEARKMQLSYSKKNRAQQNSGWWNRIYGGWFLLQRLSRTDPGRRRSWSCHRVQPMRYSATTSAAICFLVLLSSLDLTRAARATITLGCGVSVMRSGSGELRHSGKGGVGAGHWGNDLVGRGGHATDMGIMVPIGVGCRGPDRVIGSLPTSNPR